MTQKLIGNMLGVRRGTATESALKMQQAGLIRYARGHITVLDRGGLEERSGDCYAMVKAEYDRLPPFDLATEGNAWIVDMAHHVNLPGAFADMTAAQACDETVR